MRSVFGGHFVENLDIVVALELIAFLDLGEAGNFGVDRLEVVAKLSRDLLLRRQNEHASDASKDLLCILSFINGLKSDFGLNLLALGELEGFVGNAELFDGGEEVTLEFAELIKNHWITPAHLPVLNLPLKLLLIYNY